jgi:hypothetical protein
MPESFVVSVKASVGKRLTNTIVCVHGRFCRWVVLVGTLDPLFAR